MTTTVRCGDVSHLAFDSDGIGNNADTDDDGDGVEDAAEVDTAVFDDGC